MKLSLVVVLALLAASALALDLDRSRAQAENGLFAPGKGFSPIKTPGNKNPAAPSDKGKASKPQDAKAKADAGKKAKAAADKSKAIANKKLHMAPINKLVTIVTKPQFAELAKIKVGGSLKNWIGKVGGAIKDALSNLVKGIKNLLGFKFLTTSSSAAANKVCHWIMAVDNNFKQTAWSVTNMDNQDSWGSWHPGTCTVGSYVERQGEYNCLSGATQKSNPQTASATSNANFVCLDKDGTMVSPPGNCKAKIQFYAGYKGTTYSQSDSYLVCPLGSRYIQVSAAHEAQLQVGTNVLASKGAVTTTGNSITETYSFTLTAGAGAGTGKDGPSSSANVGLSFGYTVQEVKDFGEKSNVVAFQNQGPYDVPFNAIITTVASSQINGAGRVFGTARSSTDAWLMCVVGTSTDCGMPNTGVMYGVGSSDQLKIYSDACNGVFKNNNIGFFL